MTVSLQVADAERAGADDEWWRFVRNFLCLAILGLAAVGVVNYVVNPEGLFATHWLPQLLWGARPQKAAMLESVQPKPQALIMGSSRVMNLAPAEVLRLTGLVAFNAGVDGAKAEDFYILLRYAVERAHLKPRLLIIGCDVEVFHNQEPVHNYLQQPSELASFLWSNGFSYWRWNSFTKLLSYDETELSLISLYKLSRGERRTFSHVDADGRTHYDEWEQKRTTGQLDPRREIADTIDHYGSRYDQYTGLSEERIKYLDATLQYAHQNRIDVIVFLTPVHPAVEAGLRSRGYEARKREVTAVLQNVCAKYRAPFYDFSSPPSFAGDPDHFYDGVHYDDTISPLILPRMLPVKAHAVQ